MSYSLIIDDERNFLDITWVKLPLVNWHIVRNYEGFIDIINRLGLPKRISFDHDLGENSYKEVLRGRLKEFKYENLNEEKTGMDCAKWIVLNGL